MIKYKNILMKSKYFVVFINSGSQFWFCRNWSNIKKNVCQDCPYKVSDNVIARVHKITCTFFNVRKQAQVMRHTHLSILLEIKNFKSSKNKIYHKCSLFLLSEGRVYNPDVSRHLTEKNLAENWTLS